MTKRKTLPDPAGPPDNVPAPEVTAPVEPADAEELTAPALDALDALDAVQEAAADPADDGPPAAARKRGRPRGARTRRPNKRDWQRRARQSEAELAAARAEAEQRQAEALAAAQAGGAALLQAPCELVARWYFGRLAVDRGEHWRLTDAEAEGLATAWAAALAPWAPMMAKYAPVGAAVAVTYDLVRQKRRQGDAAA